MFSLRRADISVIAQTSARARVREKRSGPDPRRKWKPWQQTKMFPLESTFRRFPHMLSTTTPLRDGRRERERDGSDNRRAPPAALPPGRRPTVWGSWGRRCSAAARGGSRRTPACLGSAGSPGSRSRETCTLQGERRRRQMWPGGGGGGPLGFLTHPPWCSPCRSRST